MLMQSALTLVYVIAKLEPVSASLVSLEQPVKEVCFSLSLYYSIFNLIFLILIFLDECPNKCSGRGNCILISDAALFLGPSNGNSLSIIIIFFIFSNLFIFHIIFIGVVYSNWDKNSIQMCECSDGYYGADCSLCKFISFFSFSLPFSNIFFSQ